MKYVNPLKLREYLSAGLPVVSTAVPEVQRYAHACSVAATPDEMVAHRARLRGGGGAGARSEAMKSSLGGARRGSGDA